MPLPAFDAPGFLDDLNDDQKKAWSEWISGQIDAAIDGDPVGLEFDAPRAQFFNPTKVDLAADVATLDIEWTAFPRNVQSHPPAICNAGEELRAADLQDEYRVNGAVDRDANTDKITRVTFTCEGPEYWEFFAAGSPDVARLYKKYE
ncbi:MAG: hypothetical protein U0936_18425 [Planctomycetaceae bacterium]